MIITGVILFIVAIAIDLFTDYRLWLKHRDVAHQKGAAIRLAALAPCGVCFTIAHPWTLVPAAIITVAMIGCVYWLFFDGIYNKLRGFGWWFNGSPEGKTDDSLFDKFLRVLTDSAESFLKITGAAGCTLVYVLSFLKY